MKRQSMTAYGAPLEETEAPTPVPSGTEVLVRVSHCGVCHSDIHMHDGYFDLGDGKQLDVRGGRELPFTLGHEIAGVVEAVGPEADGVEIGGHFAVYPWAGCGSCGVCRRGDEHLCTVTRHLGITVDGGYATHVVVPHPRYLLDASGIDPQLAGSYMCSGLTAYGALRKVLDRAGDGPLLVVGLGGVGMMALQFAKALYGGDVLVADVDAAKREKAMELGAALALDPADETARKTTLKATGGGVAAALDFVGAESSLAFAQGALRKGGTAVVAGLMGGRLSMPIPMFPLRAIGIVGTFVGSLTDAREMLDLVRSGRIAPIPVELRQLAAADQALNDLRAGRVLGRVVLTP